MSTLNTYNLKSPDSANTNLALDASGNVAIQAGSASAPSVYVTGDANTGLYSPGADQVALTTGGTARLYIDSSGRVGIGTTSPARPLQVNSTQISARFASSSSDSQIEIIDSSGNVVFGSSSANAIVQVGGAERARIDTSGRLLVGTSSARSNFFNSTISAQFQTEGAAVNDRIISLVSSASSGSSGPVFIFGKQNSGAVGGNTVVVSGDNLGNISFQGSDGTEFVEGASISAFVDGTPGANDMPGRLVFSTTADGASSPTERMRITAGGEVLIGQQSSFAIKTPLGVYAANYALAIGTASGTGQEAVRFYNGASAVGTISTTASSTAYNTSSDYRLKENITPVTDGIARLQQLKPSRFNFIADPDTVVDGFIAHEVQSVVPEAITGEKDAVDDDGNPIYQGIDQSKLVPLLTAALQEAIGEIESLKARVVALETP